MLSTSVSMYTNDGAVQLVSMSMYIRDHQRSIDDIAVQSISVSMYIDDIGVQLISVSMYIDDRAAIVSEQNLHLWKARHYSSWNCFLFAINILWQ